MSTNNLTKEQIIQRFISQSPPGEVNDVFNDVRALLQDDDLLQATIIPAFEKYNKEQFTSVILPGNEHATIISEFNVVEGSKFFDGKSRKTFDFDHIQLEASSIEDYTATCPNEQKRLALIEAADAYVNDHFMEGTVNVFDVQEDFYIVVVGNKYNPNNFWNGRWRSTWKVSKVGEITGTLKVHVHYYEDGNVQMKVEKELGANTEMKNIHDDDSFARSVIKTIDQLETKFQTSLNEAYVHISENTFKELRRALPVTRTKLDWNAISNYKLGAELSSKQ